MNHVMMPDEYGTTAGALGAYSVRLRELAVRLVEAVADFDIEGEGSISVDDVQFLVGEAELCSEVLIELSRAVMVAGESS